MSSILTNTTAMLATQNLNGVNKNLSKIQDILATGKKVANSKDNAGIWSIASTMESDIGGYGAVQSSLNLASAALGVARNASESIYNTLKDIKALVVAAQDDNADRAKLTDDIKNLLNNIDSVIKSASFNGNNLLSATANSTFLSGLVRDSAGAVTTQKITVGQTNLDTAFTTAKTPLEAITDGTTAAAALTALETFMTDVQGAAATYGGMQKAVDTQIDFTKKIVDAYKTGVGALVDADMEEVSAQLSALQVQQQLSIQSLSIANQNPQSILSLFR